MVTTATVETPLARILCEHGARIAVRHGYRVATDFGSVAAETSVCLRSVGLVDRFGRSTFDVRGPREKIDAALARMGRPGNRAWSARVHTNRVVVRCEPSGDAACRAEFDDDDLLVVETTQRLTAIGLVGPRAGDVMREARAERAPFTVTVLMEPLGVEVLVPRHAGADAWTHLLRYGGPFGIACVGFDALEHLAASRRVARM